MAAAAVATGIAFASRAAGSILGALVADAAAAPLHWIYDPTAVAAAIAGTEATPEFLAKSACPFYARPTGSQSVYGDQALVVLRAAVKGRGWDHDVFASEFETFFGPGTDYDIEAKLGRPATREDWPVPGGWRTKSIREFLTNRAAGKAYPEGVTEDAQIDAAAKIAPLVALYSGKPDLLRVVEEVTRTTQNDELALSVALATARILEQVFGGATVEEAVAHTLAELKNPARAHASAKDDTVVAAIEAVLAVADDKSHAEVVKTFGASCGVPGCFQNVLHIALHASKLPADQYLTGVRSTLVASGDNCSRSVVVGAILGAAFGVDAVPADWVAKTTHAAETVRLADELIALRA